MRNEIILITTLVMLYSMTVIFYRIWGAQGLYCFTVVATISANIEVLILVSAFGMQQTLGNVLFASTFLITDILSELEGKEKAKRAVTLGIATSVVFLFISQSWLLYVPSENDWVSPAIRAVFSNTPRLLISSLVVYSIVQFFDVWLYHLIWKKTEERCKDSKRFLWLRNNAATMTSQLINSILYTFAAFYGIYEVGVLFSIIQSSFIIFIFTSLLDTPAVYIARKMKSLEQK